MEDRKRDTTVNPKENASSSGCSRRSFVIKAGIAGVVASASSLWPVTLDGNNHSSNSSREIEPAQNVISKSLSDSEKENGAMPLIRIDAFEGRGEAEVLTLLDAVHRAVVKAFHVPLRDRYQIYQAHPKGFLVTQDTGLGIARTNKAVIVTVVSKKRDEILKRRFYEELTQELATSSSIASSDVVVTIIENSAADWSFGKGEAQFLTGDLG